MYLGSSTWCTWGPQPGVPPGWMAHPGVPPGWMAHPGVLGPLPWCTGSPTLVYWVLTLVYWPGTNPGELAGYQPWCTGRVPPSWVHPPLSLPVMHRRCTRLQRATLAGTVDVRNLRTAVSGSVTCGCGSRSCTTYSRIVIIVILIQAYSGLNWAVFYFIYRNGFTG